MMRGKGRAVEKEGGSREGGESGSIGREGEWARKCQGKYAEQSM